LQDIGKCEEPIDGEACAAVLPSLNSAGRNADGAGEARLREAALVANLGEASAIAAIDRTLSLHGVTSENWHRNWHRTNRERVLQTGMTYLKGAR
jgi:hypothetical protein